MAFGDRPEEGGVVRHPDGDLVVLPHRLVGGGGAEALREGGVDAAVDDLERLQVVGLDLDPGPGGVGIEVGPLGADESGETARRCLGSAHGAGTIVA